MSLITMLVKRSRAYKQLGEQGEQGLDNGDCSDLQALSNMVVSSAGCGQTKISFAG